MPNKYGRFWLNMLLAFTVISWPLFDRILRVFPKADESYNNCPISKTECMAKIKPSSVECKEAPGLLSKYPFTQSCMYKNIFFINNSPILMFTSKEEDGFMHDVRTMKNRDDFYDHFDPEKRLVSDMKTLCDTYCMKSIKDTAALSDFWLGNVGHALFDQMYAIFVGLIEYNQRTTQHALMRLNSMRRYVG